MNLQANIGCRLRCLCHSLQYFLSLITFCRSFQTAVFEVDLDAMLLTAGCILSYSQVF